MNKFTNRADGQKYNQTVLPVCSLNKFKNVGSPLSLSVNNDNRMIVPKGAINRTTITPVNRAVSADMINVHKIMVEMMFANLVNKYIYSVVSQLEEQNMMRHNIKRLSNILLENTRDLMKKCKPHDKAQVRIYTEDIFPTLSLRYYENDGSLASYLQTMFHNEYKDRLDKIYSLTYNMLNDVKAKYPSIVADLEMIVMLCVAIIDYNEAMRIQILCLTCDINKGYVPMCDQNQKIIGASNEMIRQLIGSIPMPEEGSNEVRKLTQELKDSLVKPEIWNMTKSAITAMKMDYIEYVMADLCIRHKTKQPIQLKEYRMLFLRLGSKKRVREFFKELGDVCLPDGDYDILDVMDLLPLSAGIGDNETAIATFRRLSLEDKIKINPETYEEIEYRNLRREVYRNGPLPIFILKYLYYKLKSKKAIIGYLKKAGEEVMASTIAALKTIKTTSLKINPNKRHIIIMGPALRFLYLYRKYTREQFAEILAMKVESLKSMEAIMEISIKNRYDMEKAKDYLYDMSKRLCIDQRYIWFSMLEETEEECEKGMAVPPVFDKIMEMITPKQKPTDKTDKSITKE